MSYLANYRKRVGLNTSSTKDKITLQMQRDFENNVNDSLSGVEVFVTRPNEVSITEDSDKIKCLINDITFNDKRALDEKKLLVNVNENIDVGCYVLFDNCYWLIIFKEHKVTKAYKRFVIRRCNQIFNYKYKGEVYNIPVSIENLTIKYVA